MVGEVYRARQAARHQQVLCHLHERHRRVLWLDRPVISRPGQRRTLCDEIPNSYHGGHGAGAVPPLGQLGHPKALRKRGIEHGRDAESGSWHTILGARRTHRQYQWLRTEPPIQHCHEAYATARYARVASSF